MEMIQITNHQIFKLIICRISYEIKVMPTGNRYNKSKYVLVHHNWYESRLFITASRCIWAPGYPQYTVYVHSLYIYMKKDNQHLL